MVGSSRGSDFCDLWVGVLWGPRGRGIGSCCGRMGWRSGLEVEEEEEEEGGWNVLMAMSLALSVLSDLGLAAEEAVFDGNDPRCGLGMVSSSAVCAVSSLRVYYCTAASIGNDFLP